MSKRGSKYADIYQYVRERAFAGAANRCPSPCAFRIFRPCRNYMQLYRSFGNDHAETIRPRLNCHEGPKGASLVFMRSRDDDAAPRQIIESGRVTRRDCGTYRPTA